MVIDYGLGNLASVSNALDKLGIPNRISSDEDIIRKANGLILPGVGAAGKGMRNLKNRRLDKIIMDEITNRKPILGICLGMQLLFEKSEEGDIKCLGILKGRAVKFRREKKVPQIGWNEVKIKNPASPAGRYESIIKNILFKNISDNSYFYFVNSYYCLSYDKSIIAAETEYGERFPSVIVKDNIVATQFHPEKSGDVGMQFIKNWRNLC